jgi:hypothetical protein
MMAISHLRDLIEDTSGYNYFTGSLDDRLIQRQKDYAEQISRSSFVLCLRGIATSSYRTYEAMAAARCPVIISDHWVQPGGPDDFAIFVSEADVKCIPALLESIEDGAIERGRLAREAYDAWFGPEVRFHRIVDWCGEVFESRRIPERIMQWIPTRQVIEHRLHEVKHSSKQRAKALLKR